MTDEIVQGREPARPPSPAGRHRRTLVMAGVVLAFLVVVAVAGLFTRQPKPAPTASPTPSASSSSDDAVTPALQLTSTRCAGLDGTRLTVGFGVRNAGTTALIVTGLQPSFPIGGLAPDAATPVDRTACPAAAPGIPFIVGPGDETVFAFVLTPAQAACIAPLVVDVAVMFAPDAGAATTVDLKAFPDLGGFDLPSRC